jgi:predicted ATPase
MKNSVTINRVVLRNYKSIGYCDVKLGSLCYLVGANGSGKSNFLDALHFVKDALTGSLDNALNERGGMAEVRRRSIGHPNNFGIRLDLTLNDGRSARYAFKVHAIARGGYAVHEESGGYEVHEEKCVIDGVDGAKDELFFHIVHGKLKESSETSFPSVTKDRLALVSASGLTVFRPVFDALSAMGFYNLNPKIIRELQKPQDGRLLKPVGENIASVIGHLGRVAPEQLAIITEYLQLVVPMVHGVHRLAIGPMETIEFFQQMAGAKHPWRFLAQNMSDGTLRALGILTALFQGNRDFSPTLIGIEEPETALHPGASAVLREALARASQNMQVIVTCHSPDVLNDASIDADSLLVVVWEKGETRIAPIEAASREAIVEHLFSAGELLRLNQLQPDPEVLIEQQSHQSDLFGDA